MHKTGLPKGEKEKETANTEIQNLRKEAEKYKPTVENFIYGSEKLCMILNDQRTIFNKAGLDFKSQNKQKFKKKKL